MLNITLWGTRGSVPVSGPQFQRHGGATTCIEVDVVDPPPDTPSTILIDCGSGLSDLGRSAGSTFDNTLLLQTHFHWDHIQGFPMFAPLFSTSTELQIMATRRGNRTFRDVLANQMAPPLFPVRFQDLPATLLFEEIPGAGRRRFGALEVEWDELCHPSGSTGYRITYGETTFVFSGDVEVQMNNRDELVNLARRADLLVMDAQYLEVEYAERRGFGHSTPKDAVEVAREAHVNRLIMTHHDPQHDDDRLDHKVDAARRYAGPKIAVDNGRDGLEVTLGDHGTGRRRAIVDRQLTSPMDHRS